MNPTTLRLSEDTLDTLADEAEERGLSRSQYIREVIDERHDDKRLQDRLRADYERQIDDYEKQISDYEEQINDYEERIAELEQELEDKENTIADLRRQLAATNRRVDQHQDLVEFVEEQRELTRYQERRQRLLDDANILRRWKWKLTGVPVDREEE